MTCSHSSEKPAHDKNPLSKRIDGRPLWRHAAGEVKPSYFSCLILFLLLWFVGVALHLPGTQRDLAVQARSMLDRPEHDGIFGKVVVSFSGQEATLTGAVAREEEKVLLEKIVREQVRLRDQQPQRNPVTAVHNRAVVDAAAAPARRHVWLLVAVYGSQKRIEGLLKFPAQRQELLEKMEQRWPSANAELRERANQVIVDERAWPADDWQQTLKALPDFPALLAGKNGIERAMIAVTTGDGKWQTFAPSTTDAEVAAALASARVSLRDVELALNDFRIRPESEPAVKPSP
jgi:hypothetical protein